MFKRLTSHVLPPALRQDLLIDPAINILAMGRLP